MKPPKTDNQITLAVLQALDDFKGVQKGLAAYSQVPFMQREMTKYERAKRRLENMNVY